MVRVSSCCARWTHATRISTVNRIIVAVGKHVVAEDALAGGNEGICIDESAYLGIIITALQVIEPGILGGRLAKRQFLDVQG